MKKTYLITLILAIFLVTNVSAYFTKSHTYWVLDGFENVDSPTTDLCRDRIDVVIDGNVGCDIPVLHYFDEKFRSYISTHTKGSGYEACLDEAGSDPDLKCFCVGLGLHIIQDAFSHVEGGLVPKYLRKSWSPNFFGHMVIEKNFELKHLAYLEQENDPTFISGKIEYYAGFNENALLCNNLFNDYKYVELLNKLTGIDTRNDINIFCNGYKGKGFYNTVYNEKLSLPFWFWGISIGLILFGGIVAFFIGKFGKTGWKWILVLIYLLIAALGAIILWSIMTNNTWNVISAAIELPTKFGLLTVSDSDLIDYNGKISDATRKFLETGQIPYDDVSGLSYVDRLGNPIVGELNKAETSFKFVLFPIIIILFALLNIWLFKKAFKQKKKL